MKSASAAPVFCEAKRVQLPREVHWAGAALLAACKNAGGAVDPEAAPSAMRKRVRQFCLRFKRVYIKMHLKVAAYLM